MLSKCRRIAHIGSDPDRHVDGHATIVTNDPDLVVLAPGQAGDHPPMFAAEAWIKIIAVQDRVNDIQQEMKCDWAEEGTRAQGGSPTPETTAKPTRRKKTKNKNKKNKNKTKKKKKRKKGDQRRSEL